MSNDTNQDINEASADGACACSCGCGAHDEPAQSKCCAFCPGEKTLAFWVLRLWLGFRALFTGLGKFETKVVEGSPKDISAIRVEDYGSVLANKAAEAAGTGPAADAANLQFAAEAAKKTVAEAANVAETAQATLAAVADKATDASKAAIELVNKAIKVANEAAGAANEASKAVSEAASGTTQTVHHGLPLAGDWTLQGFISADIWYMPKWALLIFESTLGYILIALGVTLLLGIGTRLSLFFQGLLYSGLTLGFIAISKEPGSSAGITMLGVHIALVVLALLLAKYNKLAVLKKF
jgi:thiosulfate dehydrogenase [quinone] large subunit